MYIAAGQRQTTLMDKIFMSTETSSHFSHLLQVSKQSLWSLILYTFFHDFMILYMFTAPGQGQTTPKGQSLPHTKFQGHRPFGSRKEDFFKILTYMGMAAILVMWSGPFEQTYVPPSHGDFIWNLASIGPVVSEEKMFKECGRQPDGRTTDDGRRRPTYPISSPMSHRLRWAKMNTVNVLKISSFFFSTKCLSMQMQPKNICWRSSSWASIYEPPHDKTNKMTVRPAKAKISLGIRSVWSESSLCVQWVATSILLIVMHLM